MSLYYYIFALLISYDPVLLAFVKAYDFDFQKESEKLKSKEYLETSYQQKLKWLDVNIESTTVRRYFASQVKVDEAMDRGDYTEAYKYCQQVPPDPQDLDARINCASSAEGVLPITKLTDELNEVISLAKTNGNISALASAYSNLGWYQSLEGDIASSFDSYQKALVIVPKDKFESFSYLYHNAATLYIEHGNLSYVRKGIDLLNEIRSIAYKKIEEDNLEKGRKNSLVRDIQIASYNIGNAYLILQEYEASVREFEAARAYKAWEVFSVTFAALAAAYADDNVKARKYLSEMPSDDDRSPVERSYLSCYRELIKKKIEGASNLKSCLELHNEVPVSVKIDVYKRILAFEGTKYEVSVLRNFYDLYLQSIEKAYKDSASQAASLVELSRLETELIIRDQKLALGETIRRLFYVLLLALFLLSMLFVMVARSRKVIKDQSKDLSIQKDILQQILDHIDEGIIKINRDLSISPIYSKFSTKLLGQNPDQINTKQLLEMLGTSPDHVGSSIASLRAAFGEGELAWEMNKHHLPVEGQINGKPFLLYWNCVALDGEVSDVMVAIRDASLKNDLLEERHEKERIVALIQSGEQGSYFISGLYRKLGLIADFVRNSDSRSALGLLHTLKGEARQVHLNEVQDLCHNLELTLKSGNIRDSITILDQLQKEASILSETNKKVFHQSSVKPTLLQQINSILIESQKRLSNVGLTMTANLHIQWHLLRDEDLDSLGAIILHGLTNSVDHGFLRPKMKDSLTTREAKIELSIRSIGANMVLEIADNGAGIDIEVIKQKCIEHGLDFDESNLDQILAHPEFSTVSSGDVSKTSGQGLGFGALVSAADNLGAGITIANNPDSGTRLTVAWSQPL
ncbi:ATP-binding protein [Pseudobacteriovorax antillogorgiicola]|uniref:Hpt domain-containing protein n=1 Tax=Pseudobacteriovorax antillogorgiicola TaxID=1513793 RepID=A0A1Y6BM54_9BACT|nr:ATP-binding protein [Pseudobacteriovorax antillogorgiicola]TCS54605.1 Hpt domain-containing protein [Pseudobacteriovorax antillogorgiicola]SMF17602.1 Hpt domain-containing protein [Pseudobacteriovorax antillogorgiicola]